MKTFIHTVLIFVIVAMTAVSCQKGDLTDNPNAATENSTVPASLLLNHLTYSLYAGGGVTDNRSSAVYEYPWDLPFIWGQFHVSNYQYYRGNNFYNWSNSATDYDMLRYANLMEQQASKQYGTTPNPYNALAKFFKAYSFIWLTQRVGDIPMMQAGDVNNLTPAYDKQHDVYQNCLALLDTANTLLNNLTPATKGTIVSGDIYGLTGLQWQKVVNTYKLRVLISLSRRAADNTDLNIPGQFANIFNNPAQYPLLSGNSDNLKFVYNSAYNPYSIFLRGNAPYNNYSNICKTFLDITTSTGDPRTFIAATPAPAQLTAGKSISDFTAYVGADINLDLATLNLNSSQGKYSFANYLRYYTSSAGANAEPYIIIGYPEMCFNIAEAINLGWVTSANAGTWYNNGINASLSWLGLSQGKTFTIGDVAGTVLGTVTIDINSFLNNPNVAYKGNNDSGRAQILTQKYVAFFQNSGWEAFYNWRRTGIPTFSQGGSGIGTPTAMIPRRWQYPQDEINYNNANYTTAITSQFGGTDDLTKDTWLTK
jgi:hypothetical protein